MTMFFDTHVHLDSVKFDEDRQEVINRAREAGVGLMVNIGFNRETIPTTLRLAEENEDIYAAIGWHPVDSIDLREGDLEWIRDLTRHEKVVAIGEIGLDYHWDTSPKDLQQEVFRQQIRMARELGKPIIIHNRDAHADVVRILQEEHAEEVGGIMHCFSGSPEIAKECLELGFYISFGGPLTFLNAKVPKEVLKTVPIDRLLIETDCPYLAPHPFRGKKNEPSYVLRVAETMAELTGKTVEEIATITTENGKKCFGITAK